jgi:preprotein translocase subunit SecA
MGPLYRRLLLSVGTIQQETRRSERRRAYADDVTYATATEVGFDLLRDSMAWSRNEMVLRPLSMALYDDVDFTLVDEARNPLVLAGEESAPGDEVPDLSDLVRGLTPGSDYETDAGKYTAYLTDQGVERVEEALGRGDLFTPENVAILTQVNLALHAEALVRRDVDYLVRDGEVQMIDEHRGRVALGRRWPFGLQWAIEDKEGVPRTGASRTLATTTLQAVARLYPKRAGMTATAFDAAPEFGMEVVYIPPHRPCVRDDYTDAIFTHAEARDHALLAEVEEAHASGRPVLVGTGNVEASERLAALLRQAGIDCEVLNAKNDEAEAEIIARAGRAGAVTISTSMAGRGTDIRLGGGDDAATSEREYVAALGGLCVLGRGRSASTRIDDQLRGRAGRQGDPGSSQFFVALDDELMERYAVRELLPAKYKGARLNGPIEDASVAKEVERAQRIIAARHASVRKTMWVIESYLEKQRRIVQHRRREVLQGKAPSLCADASPVKYASDRGRVGPKALALAEAQLTLAWIDRGWADHLARIADARESIQLMTAGVSIGTGFGRERPLDTFRRLARESFEQMEEEIDEGVIASFERAELSERGVDLRALGLARPRRTWTYLMQEQPIDTQPKLRMVPTLLRSVVDKLFGNKTTPS